MSASCNYNQNPDDYMDKEGRRPSKVRLTENDELVNKGKKAIGGLRKPIKLPNQKSKIKCDYCGVKGHNQKTCQKRKDNNQSSGGSNAALAINASTPPAKMTVIRPCKGVPAIEKGGNIYVTMNKCSVATASMNKKKNDTTKKKN
ncbi:hypothetical protein CDL12_28951 [Handroanthus impetiginosus]|uniref:Uncharacterized protein n=1 Tax=Handroanthus impetiginosus TaxID=429701 RepID=A0A2G9FZV1_9LAMI|nr:hypothetical protein CDL12_28951 [Handroanthus impetiginosus]